MSIDELLQEARAANLIAYKERCKWIGQRLRSDPSQVEVLSKVVRRMGWKISVSGIAEHLTKQKAKGKGLAEKFKAIASTPIMTMAELKARFPIKWYCETILKLSFSASNQTKCPFHGGTSDTTFVIKPEKGIFTCFGGCPPKDEREYFTGDVIDLHQRAFNLSKSAAKQSLERLANSDAGLLNAEPVPSFFFSPAHKAKAEPKPKTTKVDAELVAKVLAKCPPVSFAGNGATAFDFAKLLLGTILRPEDKPIVFFHEKEMPRIIGSKARRVLERMPNKLQYLASGTAINETGSNTNDNIKEQIFLDVEFDHMRTLDQLKILWWLKRVRKWNLISLTYSGGKSYHGLFYIRGKTKEQVQAMKDFAIRLGACHGSLRAHQPVRFPGGYRRERGEGEQTIVYLANGFVGDGPYLLSLFQQN